MVVGRFAPLPNNTLSISRSMAAFTDTQCTRPAPRTTQPQPRARADTCGPRAFGRHCASLSPSNAQSESTRAALWSQRDVHLDKARVARARAQHTDKQGRSLYDMALPRRCIAMFTSIECAERKCRYARLYVALRSQAPPNPCSLSAAPSVLKCSAGAWGSGRGRARRRRRRRVLLDTRKKVHPGTAGSRTPRRAG